MVHQENGIDYRILQNGSEGSKAPCFTTRRKQWSSQWWHTMQPSVHARKAAAGKKPHGCSAKSGQRGKATGFLPHILTISSAFRSFDQFDPSNSWPKNVGFLWLLRLLIWDSFGFTSFSYSFSIFDGAFRLQAAARPREHHSNHGCTWTIAGRSVGQVGRTGRRQVLGSWV